MLRILGVSRTGYNTWLRHLPTDQQRCKATVKTKIQRIYDDSKQNDGAPKITKALRNNGEVISDRTVGVYMKEMGIKAQWTKPYIVTTKDSHFNEEL